MNDEKSKPKPENEKNSPRELPDRDPEQFERGSDPDDLKKKRDRDRNT
jgi:hypothetical protein